MLGNTLLIGGGQVDLALQRNISESRVLIRLYVRIQA